MPKKSQVVLYGLIIGFIVAITASMIYIHSKKDFSVIGDSSLALIGISKEAEKALLYIDQSAKYSLLQAVYDIAQNGGVSEIENIGTDEAFGDYECGKFKDAYVWYEVKKTDQGYNPKECFDEKSVSSNTIYLFEKNLNVYFDSYPLDVPTEGYTYNIKDDSEIYGTAASPIKINIILGKDLKIATKPYKPSKPRQYKVDLQGKFVEEKKPAETKVPEKGKENPEEKTKLKSLVDFSGLDSDKLGEESIDITGLCPKGHKCSLTNDAYKLLLAAQKKAHEKKLSLGVIDSYRTKQQQIDIWTGKTASRWAQRISDETKRRAKVCYPYGDDVEQRCPHLTGNAIDVVFKDKTTKTMTGADWLQLRDIMTSTGWVWYGNQKDLKSDETGIKKGELWHFECCGTQRVARAEQAGVTAIV